MNDPLPPDGLPVELQAVVEQLLERARLDEEEASAVGRELRSHLSEGLDRGRSIAELIEEFGDVELTAGLIARSRRRVRIRDEALPPEKIYSHEGGLRGAVDHLRSDLVYAVRSLKRSPGFTLVAILMLALGVGVNTAIFSTARATMLSGLPLTDADLLVRPSFTNPSRNIQRTNVPHIDYREWRDQRDIFAALATYGGTGVDLEEDPPLRIFGSVVSEDFFTVFQTAPVIGRAFSEEEFQEGAPEVVILARGFWEDRFGGDPEVLGSTIRLSGSPRTIIGVVDESTVWPDTPSFWVPAVLEGNGAQDRDRRDNYSTQVLGRLQPGVSPEQARVRLAELSSRVLQDSPQLREGFEVVVETLHTWVIGPQLPAALTMLLAAATFVFLIACTNVAGLLVTRASARRRQLAVRVAMGARPWQLARHLLAESLLLFVAGGTIGFFVAIAAVDLILAAAPPSVPRLDETSVQLSELIFALALAGVAGLAFGLYPALKARNQDPVGDLKEGLNASESRGAGRMRRVLVVAEVALSVVLLAGAGLMIRSLNAIHSDDPGFRYDRLVTFFMSLPSSRYEDDAAVERTYDEMTARLEALPGVAGAATSTLIPIGGGGIGLGRSHLALGMPEPPAGPEYGARWIVVDPDLFQTLGWPLLRGRGFTAADDASAPPVAVISESLATQMFPDEDPIGQQVRSWRDENLYREIVGVVGDLRLDSVTDRRQAIFVVPVRQITWDRFRTVILRTSVEPAPLIPQLQKAVSEVDPLLPVNFPRTGAEVFEGSSAASGFTTLLLGLFAALGLIVATVGLYGVLANTVNNRTRELGIRTALGASRRDTVSMVIRQALVLAAVGLAAGIAGVLVGGDLMADLLFEVTPRDPVTLVAVAASLLAVALLASWLPARRATTVDPVRALRMD